jgi:anthranilate/para-aminobenzoate synthase component I
MYPSLNQFQRWAMQYKAIPIWIEPELPADDLLAWVHNQIGGQHKFFFMHSAPACQPAAHGQPNPQARYSYFSLEGPRQTLEARDGQLHIKYYAEGGQKFDSLKVGNPLDRFFNWLHQWNGPRADGLPPFWGGVVGHFNYESARYMDPALEALFSKNRKPHAIATQDFFDFEFGLYDTIAAVDHIRRRLWLVHTVLLADGKRYSPGQLERIYRMAQDRLRRQAVRLQKALRNDRPWGTFEASDVRSNQSEAAYRLMVRRAKGHIISGDIYQANLSQSLNALWEGDPWTLYRQLNAINPSPYAALWRSGNRWIVSASPELLLRQEANHVETRPIAGTYPRTGKTEQDQKIIASLTSDVKERAEHLMLVDLERNDLSRVCKSPSVHVQEAFSIEAYSHVFHLVSDIRGELASGKTWKDAVKACFPGGTITGCPKIRCMELVQRLEPQPRGPYCGSFGWIGFNGDTTLNILIRSFFLDKGRSEGVGRLRFPVGAGIVADSDPAREYQETLHKAQALLHALNGAASSALKFLPPEK